MNKIGNNILSQCSSIEDLLDIETKNGEVNYYDIGNDGRDYNSFINRYKYFKDNLKEKAPSFSVEELLKYDAYRKQINEAVYEFRDHYRFMQVLEFEFKKGLI